MDEHEHAPMPDTIYSVDRRAGRPADLRYRDHYPVEAICECGLVIRLEHLVAIGPGGEWQSTGRKPGETE
jgi:hypothetical protein